MDTNIKKALRSQVKQKVRESFEASLPMPRETFAALFDFIDENLAEYSDTPLLAKAFLQKQNNVDAASVLAWLADNGGYCDCEILNNCEELFE